METKKELAQTFFDQADVFMIIITSQEVVADINKKALELLGYRKEEVVGKNWLDNFVPNQERENIKRLFQDVLKSTLRHAHYEHSVVTKQGDERILSFHNILVSDESGKTIGILSSGVDVTERRKKEKTLKETENRLQVTLDYMLEGCQIIDYDWRYAYINTAAAKQGRKTKKELLGYTMMQVYPGIEKTELFSYLQSAMVNRVSHQIDNEFTFPDGSKGWFELRIEPVPEGILILSMDVTKNKEIQAELSRYRNRLEEVVAERTAECAKINERLTQEIQEHQKTEEGLRLRATILDNAMNAIFLVNTKGDFAYANEAATKAYGYSLDEFLNMNLSMLLQPQDASSLNVLLSRITEKGQTTLEMVHLRKDGAQMPVKLYSNLAKTKHGQFIVFVIQRLYHR
ncbi:MAG: PAS domain S-box protein [Candidatus Bathyarchaeota archaeon]|nr:PAS domain S-box protein [Candidatus Bathyarchaeota archaeon]